MVAPAELRIWSELSDSGLVVPIDQVRGYPGNPRRGDIAAIKASLLENGQYTALVVQDSTGYVVKGNNTLVAMLELGYTEVAVHRLEMTDEQALRVLLRDNKTSDDAGYDDAELAALLADLPDLDGTGWTTDELDELMRGTDLLANAATEFLSGPLHAPDDPAVPAVPAGTAVAQGGSEPVADGVSAPSPQDVAAAAAATAPHEVVLSPTPTAVPAGEPAPAPAPQYVEMSWTCTVPERDRVRAAIRLAQQHIKAGQSDGGVEPTAVAGLVAIADHYLTTMEGNE